MKYSIQEIADIIGAKCEFAGLDTIEWVLTDSRSLVFPETSLFFALRTAKGDGHRYIAELVERGVRNFVVSEVPEIKTKRVLRDINFLRVGDPLEALQRLAGYHRHRFSLPVVGITGSVGKTVVKEWLAQVIRPGVGMVRSPRSYNSQIGVPLSLLLIDKRAGLGVFEVGISEPGEMERLEPLVSPTIGVMTHLGDAHGENFPSRREKCREKMRLFRNSRAVVYCADDPDVAACADELPAGVQRFAVRKRQVGGGGEGEEQGFCYEARRRAMNTIIKIDQDGRALQRMSLPFIDGASVENAIMMAMTCIALEQVCGELKIGNWARVVSMLTPVRMRLEVKEGLKDCVVISDNYNSDLSGLDIALDFLVKRDVRPGRRVQRRVAILSDMPGTGIPSDNLYPQIARSLKAHGIEKLLSVGEEMEAHKHLFDMQARFFKTTDELLRSGEIDRLRDSIVLVKGASEYRFEQIASLMARRKHQTSLRVNLSAMLYNLSVYRAQMGRQGKIVCMIKADGYGCGAIEIAKTLQSAGADFLAVAVSDEGVALRRAGIRAGIIVMNPEPEALRDMFKYKLQPEVYSFSLLDRLMAEAQALGVRGLPIHIKLDTGMHRLGFDPLQDMDQLIRRLKGQQWVVVRSVFSHFAGADDEQFDDFTREQFQRFSKAADRLRRTFPQRILRHICNTAAISRFPAYRADMGRLGIGLYGVQPCKDGLPLRNVATLRTVILQKKTLSEPETVGYSRRGRVIGTATIAAIPIGYADGLDRHLGNGRGYCLINGQKAPYVGNICMDMAMVNVSHIDCREGDEVIIFGDDLPITVLSDALGTIPYEILTSVSPRVVREYTQE